MNYQTKLEDILKHITGRPTLLLHACCAPCSSYVLEYLSNYFQITIYYYNPNISPIDEYNKRIAELKKFIKEMPLKNPVKLIEGNYNPDEFYKIAKGKENLKEGDIRCYECYKLRMEAAAIIAKEKKYDFFTTTLSISPYKNAKWINEIGEALANKYNINYLYADFKKKGGYQRSIELSKEYNLYRQDYCGCIYSKRARDERLAKTP